MKYPIHNKLAYSALSMMDRFLSLCVAPLLKKNDLSTALQRILICNTAHLGDVILTTALLPMLRSAFPKAEIGMLVGSWSKPVLEGHPLVKHIHLIDHWKVNRRQEDKYFRYLRMRRGTLKQLRVIQYDMAIDCGLHFPNMAPLLLQASIPIRIGFESAGFSPLLTHSCPWDPRDNHSVVEAFASLLKCLPIPFDHSLLRPTIPISPPQRQSYTVIHMGSGNTQKNWPEAHWKALVKRLAEEGTHLLFTGIGAEEYRAIERIKAELPHVENLCGKLSWNEFTTTIQNAALLIAVDTSAGHIASAVGTPAVLLYTGIHPGDVWKPYGGKVICLTQPMPCSPCFTGCHEMSCLRSLSVDTVYAAIQSLRVKI